MQITFKEDPTRLINQMMILKRLRMKKLKNLKRMKRTKRMKRRQKTWMKMRWKMRMTMMIWSNPNKSYLILTLSFNFLKNYTMLYNVLQCYTMLYNVIQCVIIIIPADKGLHLLVG